jgi:hypothetical protein
MESRRLEEKRDFTGYAEVHREMVETLKVVIDGLEAVKVV